MKFNLVELCYPLHKIVNFRAELALYIVGGSRSILYYVVQKSRRYRGRIESQIDQDFRNRARVRKIGLAGSALLVFVHFFGVAVSFY